MSERDQIIPQAAQQLDRLLSELRAHHAELTNQPSGQPLFAEAIDAALNLQQTLHLPETHEPKQSDR